MTHLEVRRGPVGNCRLSRSRAEKRREVRKRRAEQKEKEDRMASIIFDLLYEESGVPKELFQSKSRQTTVSYWRRLGICLCMTVGEMSSHTAALQFGRTSHDTALSSRDTFKKHLAADSCLRELLCELQKKTLQRFLLQTNPPA